jgi:hypothetical protein
MVVMATTNSSFWTTLTTKMKVKTAKTVLETSLEISAISLILNSTTRSKTISRTITVDKDPITTVVESNMMTRRWSHQTMWESILLMMARTLKMSQSSKTRKAVHSTDKPTISGTTTIPVTSSKMERMTMLLPMATKLLTKKTPATLTWVTSMTTKAWNNCTNSCRASIKKVVKKWKRTKASTTKRSKRKMKISFSSKRWRPKCNSNSSTTLTPSYWKQPRRWVLTSRESESFNSKCISNSKKGAIWMMKAKSSRTPKVENLLRC